MRLTRYLKTGRFRLTNDKSFAASCARWDTGTKRESRNRWKEAGSGVSIDSRTIEPGQVFFAIRGPHFDGHNFVEQAFERGAVAAVVEQAFFDRAPAKLALSLVPVTETAEAIQKLARGVRRRWGGRV